MIDRIISVMTDAELAEVSREILAEKEKRAADRFARNDYPLPWCNELQLLFNGKKLAAMQMYRKRTGECVRLCKLVIDYHWDGINGGRKQNSL